MCYCLLVPENAKNFHKTPPPVYYTVGENFDGNAESLSVCRRRFLPDLLFPEVAKNGPKPPEVFGLTTRAKNW
jgi:hypothetical protein